MAELRNRLTAVALEWQAAYGNAPSITSAIAEYDAARLVGCGEDDYGAQMKLRSAVAKGHDFTHAGKRYQVKANRPSGRPGSPVTLVAKPTNYEWDFLIWLLYDAEYQLQEAWLWEREVYRRRFGEQKRISPKDMREGQALPRVSRVNSPGHG